MSALHALATREFEVFFGVESDASLEDVFNSSVGHFVFYVVFVDLIFFGESGCDYYGKYVVY